LRVFEVYGDEINLDLYGLPPGTCTILINSYLSDHLGVMVFVFYGLTDLTISFQKRENGEINC
jgi:hypothetical protein